jgi:CRP/FNR family cyclic AMP-dependent transcriptional regulator
MAKDGKIKLLKEVPLFWACNDRELSKIARIADEVKVHPGSELMKEGEPGREMFIVAEGWAKVTRKGRKIGSVGPGEVVGELALLDQGPRSATVTAETPMTMYVLAPRAFSVLMSDAPMVSFKIAKTLAARLRQAQNAPHH